MTNLAFSVGWNETYFSNIYRITGRLSRTDVDGVPFHETRFSNAVETIVVDVYESDFVQPTNYSDMEIVKVEGVKLSREGETHIEICSLDRASEEDIRELHPLHTLPLARTSRPAELNVLYERLRYLKNPALRAFIQKVLENNEDPYTALHFIECPASYGNFHHSYSGGLLVHSYETARNMGSSIRLSLPECSRDIMETGIVAALFHDIGKTRTYSLDGKPLPLHAKIPHDFLTLEICGPALHILEKTEPDLAALMRHLWTCASPGSRYGIPELHPLARFLRDADAHSAAADDYRTAIAMKGKSPIKRIGNKRIWTI